MKQKWIYSIKIMSIIFGLASISSWSLAAIQGLHFSHKDWEIACDNTGTCRAAGYQSDQDIDQPVSVLLERAAGANSSIKAQVQILPFSCCHTYTTASATNCQHTLWCDWSESGGNRATQY